MHVSWNVAAWAAGAVTAIVPIAAAAAIRALAAIRCRREQVALAVVRAVILRIMLLQRFPRPRGRCNQPAAQPVPVTGTRGSSSPTLRNPDMPSLTEGVDANVGTQELLNVACRLDISGRSALNPSEVACAIERIAAGRRISREVHKTQR